MQFSDYKLSEFMDVLSSSAPAPGGGSVAGVVLSLAGGLNSMVYSLTVGKKSFEKFDEEIKVKMEALHDECKRFMEEGLSLMEMDKKYFEELMDAYKLPKETEEEKVYRSKEIKNRTYRALQAPLKMARSGISFYDNIEFAIEYGNKMLVSDAGVSSILLHSAICSAVINVKVNLVALKDESYYEELCKELKIIEETSKERSEKISKMVSISIGL